MALSDTLAERGSRYGAFAEQAKYAQAIKRVIQSSPNWNVMADDQREALDLIANKVGRILNGDPNYSDSWHDIAGYSQLVDDRLSSEASPAPKGATPPSAAVLQSQVSMPKLPEAPVPATEPFRPEPTPEPAPKAPVTDEPAKLVAPKSGVIGPAVLGPKS